MHPRRLPLHWLVVSLAGVALCTSACSSPAEGSPPDAHRDRGKEGLPTKEVAGITVPVLPLDDYVLDTRQQHDIDQAIYVLASRCMKSKGLSWPAPLPVLGTPHSPNERRYGVSDEATVREYGYQLPPAHGVSREQVLQREKDERLRKSKMDRKATSAYTGESPDGSKSDSEGGCRGRAQAQLHLNQKSEGLSAPDKSTLEAWDATARDPRAIAANTSWSTCMKKAGYEYPDPFAAAGDPKWLPSGAPDYSHKPSQREISTALADIRCKHEVNYVDTWQATETKYQRELMRKRSKALDEARSAWQRSLRLAHEVTGKD